MSKKMLINATLSGEERVAIVEDGLLTELDIEVAGSENTKGNIYKAEVVRIEPGLQAAFVNYGAQRHGFLQIGDIHPDLWPKREGDNPQRPPINEILRRGQQILVQVVKEERGTKGAAVTTELSLAGRYMVLMANSRSRGISRKIDKEQTRKKIKEALREIDLPDEMGYIIRTAAIDQSSEELKRDFNYLFSIYQNIIAQAEKASAPALIYQESSLVLRSVRDYFTPDMDEVLIDDKEIFKQTRDFFKTVMPDHVKLVKLHQERRPIFARFQIEEQIAQLASNSVNLPSGGSIVLDQTEALVAIDVNSGKVSSEQSIESTACLVNVEAATEVARQLRLRDLGGLIVIDFIDMRQRKNARKVEKTLEQALKQDKARITQGRISSQFGLLEMSRQRIKPNLGASSYHSCPHCSGSGRIRSCESRAISLLRRIQAGTAKGKIGKVVANVALDVGILLLNQKRAELKELEQQQNIEIWIKPQPDHLPDQVDIDFIKDNGSHDENNGEQKALVDMDYSDRSWDLEPETPNANDNKESTDKHPRDSEQQTRESSKKQGDTAPEQESQGTDSKTGEDQSKESKSDDSNKPRRPRRSRSSRQRRSPAKAKAQDSKSQPETEPDTAPSTPEEPSEEHDKKPAASQDADTRTPAQKGDTPERRVSSRKPASARTRRRKTETAAEAADSAQNSTADTTHPPASEPRDNDSSAKGQKPSGEEKISASVDKSARDDGSVKAKPKRVPRRTAGKKKAQEDTSGDNAPQQDAVKAEQQEQPAPPRKRAPARRRSAPRKENTAPEAETQAVSEPEDSGSGAAQKVSKSKAATADENKKAPAARKRTPRKRTSSGEEPPQTPDSAPAGHNQAEPDKANPVTKDSPPETQGKEEKKSAPVRRRRTAGKNTSAATSNGTNETSTDSEAPATPKTPRRRAGTSRSKTSDTPAKKAETAASQDKKSAEGETKSAAKRTTRRTTTRRGTAKTDTASKSAATPQTNDSGKQQAAAAGSKPAENGTAEVAPKRRRTGTRKTASAKNEGGDNS